MAYCGSHNTLGCYGIGEYFYYWVLLWVVRVNPYSLSAVDIASGTPKSIGILTIFISELTMPPVTAARKNQQSWFFIYILHLLSELLKTLILGSFFFFGGKWRWLTLSAFHLRSFLKDQRLFTCDIFHLVIITSE